MKSVPKHVAIIMDGNGRWATARGLGRNDGHKKGAEAARLAVETAAELGIEYLTLFGFSSENWKRPKDEIIGLMNLLRFYLKKELSNLQKKGVSLKVIGDRNRLDDDIIELIEKAEELTKDNKKITVTLALSYGGRQDIVFAAKELAKKVSSKELDIEEIDEDIFAENLMTNEMPNPDLVIRTSGENRISNFLIWDIAYSELYFTEVLWPDFSKEDMLSALNFFKKCDRRYGGTSSRAAIL